MRRICRWMIVILAVLLLAAGACNGMMRGDVRPVPDQVGSAALGMVLLNDEDCLYVLAVSDQSKAHMAGLAPGDYILAIDGTSVRNTEMFDELLTAGGETMKLMVRRQNQELTLTLECR